MKRFLLFLCAAVALVSCGNGSREFYFDKAENRVYNNPEAEFDTLSYAVGMNMGLGMVLHPAGNVFDIDVIAEAINKEICKDVVDKQFLEDNKAYLMDFYKDKLQNYMFARRLTGSTSALSELPSLFNEDNYTKEKVSESYGIDMANHVRKLCYPLNMHWFMAALNDAKSVADHSSVDEKMAITTMQFRVAMTNYNSAEYPAYMAERCDKWLERVAQQKNVNALTVDGQTLYYRVDKAGNGVKPRSLKDTVSFSYDVYTQRGELVESLSERVAQIKEALEEVKADTTATNPEMKKMRLERLEAQLAENENLSVVLERAMIKGSQYGMQKVGEGGEITLWIPASLAYGERGNKLVSPNEGIVMAIHLKSVAYGPTEEELEAEKALNNRREMPKKPTLSPNVVMPKSVKTPHKSDDQSAKIASESLKPRVIKPKN